MFNKLIDLILSIVILEVIYIILGDYERAEALYKLLVLFINHK